MAGHHYILQPQKATPWLLKPCSLKAHLFMFEIVMEIRLLLMLFATSNWPKTSDSFQTFNFQKLCLHRNDEECWWPVENNWPSPGKWTVYFGYVWWLRRYHSLAYGWRKPWYDFPTLQIIILRCSQLWWQNCITHCCGWKQGRNCSIPDFSGCEPAFGRSPRSNRLQWAQAGLR